MLEQSDNTNNLMEAMQWFNKIFIDERQLEDVIPGEFDDTSISGISLMGSLYE
jgi:hypothetical protein